MGIFSSKPLNINEIAEKKIRNRRIDSRSRTLYWSLRGLQAIDEKNSLNEYQDIWPENALYLHASSDSFGYDEDSIDGERAAKDLIKLGFIIHRNDGHRDYYFIIKPLEKVADFQERIKTRELEIRGKLQDLDNASVFTYHLLLPHLSETAKSATEVDTYYSYPLRSQIPYSTVELLNNLAKQGRAVVGRLAGKTIYSLALPDKDGNFSRVSLQTASLYIDAAKDQSLNFRQQAIVDNALRTSSELEKLEKERQATEAQLKVLEEKIENTEKEITKKVIEQSKPLLENDRAMDF